MSTIEPFDVVDLIRTKRDGGALSSPEIRWMIDAYTRGIVADEQMSAMAMAILIRGMQRRETVDMTNAMVNSGERLDFSALSKPTTDKHSTGGVGEVFFFFAQTPIVRINCPLRAGSNYTFIYKGFLSSSNLQRSHLPSGLTPVRK